MSLQVKNSSAENLITQHLDTWTQAIETKSTAGRGSSNKLNLVGIQKLRELILEMAVRGLLVPQDPNDEPASVLLEKIVAEKAQLIRDKKIKKTKVLPEISEDEKPFDLPNGWEWVRLGDIGNIFNGNSVSARLKAEKFTGVEGLPYIATKDVEYGFESFDYDNGVNIPLGEPKFKVAQKGAVLVCAEGGSAGKKCGIAEQDICFGNKLFANELYSGVESKYILSLYLSPSFFERFSEVMTGIIGGISRANFLNLVAPLPPLEEQKRIVAKVDKLMALCDQLESQTLDSIATHQTLVETLLGNLVNPENTANFDQAWSLIAQNFDVLFTTEHSIDTLKQTILQLAVMGKLVPQNPNDEPASELLKKIAAEKAQLIADKKIKKTKPLPEITEAEKDFELPEKWLWERIGNVSIVVTDGTHKTPTYLDSGIKFISAKDIGKGRIDFSTCKFISEDEHQILISRCKPEKYDLLVSKSGSIGTVVLNTSDEEFSLFESLALIKFNQAQINPYYFQIALQSRLNNLQADHIKGVAVKHLHLNVMRLLLLAVAPIEEQTRIVAKVNELMALCEQLKTQLQNAQQTQIHLAQSIAQEALA